MPQAQTFAGEAHAVNVTKLATFGDLVFSGSSDGTIKRASKSGDCTFAFNASVKLSGAPSALSSGNGKLLYVLQNNNKLAAIDIASFTIVKEHEFKDYEATGMAAALDEIWVGDKKGLVHVLAEDFSQKAVIDKKHTQGVSVMTASRDGKYVASGDTYRYVYVFSTETKEEVACFPYHQARIIGLDFNPAATHLLTVGLDLTVGVGCIADKTKKLVHRPNEKELTAAAFNDNETFFTAGYDCSIRLWSK